MRNLNERADYEAALGEPAAAGARARLRPAPPAAADVRAATLGAAAAAIGVTLDEHVLAALNGDQIARDPLEPLAEGDEVAFMAADAASRDARLEVGGAARAVPVAQQLVRRGVEDQGLASLAAAVGHADARAAQDVALRRAVRCPG